MRKMEMHLSRFDYECAWPGRRTVPVVLAGGYRDDGCFIPVQLLNPRDRAGTKRTPARLAWRSATMGEQRRRNLHRPETASGRERAARSLTHPRCGIRKS